MASKIGFCELDLYLPGVRSLKEKRGILKSIMNNMRKQFNVAVAEVDQQDTWQSATIAVSTVSSSSMQAHRTMQNVIKWLEQRYPDAPINSESIEVL